MALPWFRTGSHWQAYARRIGVGVLVGASWVPVLATFHTHIGSFTYIQGESMYPYFNEDFDRTTRPDWTVNNRYLPSQNLKKGMVVTLMSPFHPEVESVKRIVALEGDEVQPRMAGAPLITVPQGHVWVEGDGPRDKVLDSNTFGPVSVNLITGKLVWQLVPLSKFGPIRWWEWNEGQKEQR